MANVCNEVLGLEGGDKHDLGATLAELRHRLSGAAEHRRADRGDVLDVAADQPQSTEVVKLGEAVGKTPGIIDRDLAVGDPGEQTRHRARREWMRHRLVKTVAALEVAESLDLELHDPRCGLARAAFHLPSARTKCYTWAPTPRRAIPSTMAVY